jgi:hypothetical protein
MPAAPKQPNVVRLGEFDYGKIKLGSTVQFLGKRHSGKTHAMFELMEFMSDKFKMAFAFSPTESTRIQLRKYMPHWCVFNLDLEVFENVVSCMTDRNNKLERNLQPKEEWLLIIDDCAMNRKFMKSQILSDLFFNGRHIACTLLMTVQYIKSAEIGLRSNQDFLFAYYEVNKNVRKSLKEEYFASLDDDFNTLFDKYTENYSALVAVRTNNSSRNPADTIFYKRARKEDPPHFFIGTEDMRVLNTCFYPDPNNIVPSVIALPSTSPFPHGPTISERVSSSSGFDLTDFEFDDEEDYHEEDEEDE